MKSKRMHFAGEDHVPPNPGTRGFIRIVERGCGGSYDYFGEFRCDHGYTWDCGDCPINQVKDDPEDFAREDNITI